MRIKKQYWIARNIYTGLYYSMSLGCGFVARALDQATLLTARQVETLCWAHPHIVQITEVL